MDGSSYEEVTALETEKAKLIEPPVMALLRLQSDYTIETDAWDKQIGCFLLQKLPLDPTDRPIRYLFHSLNDAEKA